MTGGWGKALAIECLDQGRWFILLLRDKMSSEVQLFDVNLLVLRQGLLENLLRDDFAFQIFRVAQGLAALGQDSQLLCGSRQLVLLLGVFEETLHLGQSGRILTLVAVAFGVGRLLLQCVDFPLAAAHPAAVEASPEPQPPAEHTGYDPPWNGDEGRGKPHQRQNKLEHEAHHSVADANEVVEKHHEHAEEQDSVHWVLR
mmetsp:Transcript_52397/g.113543  ORF Transcript_52397/g.113543 Transcript_52397/m.113543 type:complete len:200 (-) Transcript_52397:706-1305(-)